MEGASAAPVVGEGDTGDWVGIVVVRGFGGAAGILEGASTAPVVGEGDTGDRVGFVVVRGFEGAAVGILVVAATGATVGVAVVVAVLLAICSSMPSARLGALWGAAVGVIVAGASVMLLVGQTSLHTHSSSERSGFSATKPRQSYCPSKKLFVPESAQPVTLHVVRMVGTFTPGMTICS